MKRILLTLISWAGFAFLLLGVSLPTQAQPPTLEWTRTYNTTNHDYVNGVAVRWSGDVVMVGHTYFPGSTDAHSFVRFTDSAGSQEWYYQYEDTAHRGGYFDVTLLGNDEGFVAVGGENGPGYGARIDFIDWEGQLVGLHRLAGNDVENARSVTARTAGGYYVTSGRNFGMTGGVKGSVSTITAELELGTTMYYSDGNVSRIELRDIAAMNAGFISVGLRSSFPVPVVTTGLILVGDSLGELSHIRTLGNEDSVIILSSVCQLTDSSWVVAGTIACPYVYLYVAVVNEVADVIWSRVLDYDCTMGEAVSVARSAFGDIVLFLSESGAQIRAVLFKCDQSGDSLWSIVIEDPSSLVFPGDVAISAGGYVVACTRIALGSGKQSTMLSSYKLDARDSLAEAQNPSIPGMFRLYQNFPNPFNSSTTISYVLERTGKVNFEVFDLLGRHSVSPMIVVANAGYHVINFDASALSSGVYFYRLTYGSRSMTKTMVLIR